jgi:hypothetical protein
MTDDTAANRAILASVFEWLFMRFTSSFPSSSLCESASIALVRNRDVFRLEISPALY